MTQRRVARRWGRAWSAFPAELATMRVLYRSSRSPTRSPSRCGSRRSLVGTPTSLRGPTTTSRPFARRNCPDARRLRVCACEERADRRRRQAGGRGQGRRRRRHETPDTYATGETKPGQALPAKGLTPRLPLGSSTLSARQTESASAGPVSRGRPLALHSPEVDWLDALFTCRGSRRTRAARTRMCCLGVRSCRVSLEVGAFEHRARRGESGADALGLRVCVMCGGCSRDLGSVRCCTHVEQLRCPPDPTTVGEHQRRP